MTKGKFLAFAMGILLAVQCLMPQQVIAANVQGKEAGVATVTGLKAGVTTIKSINMHWVPVQGVSGYQIYRSSARDGKYTLIKTISAGGQAFCNVSVQSGKEYFYKVRGFVRTAKGDRYGEFSKILRTNTKFLFSKKLKAKTGVNVRKYAGVNNKVIAVAAKGTKMNILCETEDASGAKWYRVQFKLKNKKCTGYVRSDLLA